MKSLIILVSIHHQNTQKVAFEIAKVLKAKIKKPEEVSSEEIKTADILGFGSGIYFNKHHRRLLNFVKEKKEIEGKKVFIFSTSGIKNGNRFHKRLREKLLKKNCQILGEFNCLGWDSFSILKLIGGINKGRPNALDLKEAQKFAQKIKEKLTKKNR